MTAARLRFDRDATCARLPTQRSRDRIAVASRSRCNCNHCINLTGPAPYPRCSRTLAAPVQAFSASHCLHGNDWSTKWLKTCWWGKLSPILTQLSAFGVVHTVPICQPQIWPINRPDNNVCRRHVNKTCWPSVFLRRRQKFSSADVA